MAQIFKPTYTAKCPTTGKRITKKSPTWWIRYYDPNGQRHKVKGFTDRAATQALATELERKAARMAAGILDPTEEHAKRPLSEHLADFQTYLTAKGNTDDYVKKTKSRVQACLSSCRFIKASDVAPSAVISYLQKLRGDGKSITTANYYLTAVKGFTRWLWKDRRIATDPLAGMSKLSNADTDIRHARRMLTESELVKLLEATRQSDKPFRKLPAGDRFMLYATAIGTGFRACELAALTPRSFRLDGEPPTVRGLAAYTKNRKEVDQPLPPELVGMLQTYLAEKPSDKSVWPGSWIDRSAEMLRKDLDAAGIPYETDDGFADFHALRHTYISRVVQSGASPKEAQELARHSTVTLTLGRYAHVGLYDLSTAVEGLPSLLPRDGGREAIRATGTEGPLPNSDTDGAKSLGLFLGPDSASDSDSVRRIETKTEGDDNGVSTQSGRRRGCPRRPPTPPDVLIVSGGFR